MINTLHIKNIGIIDEITINLSEGFNVLTGETGAGKTLIIGSLQILAGGRFSKEMIRSGEKNCFVEISLYLPGKGFDDDMVIVSREISSQGKNTCKINGRLVTVNELKEFMTNIIDIHGQHDNQSIMNPATHIDLLDDYIGEELIKYKSQYSDSYKRYLNIKNELKKAFGDDKEKQRMLDILNYQVNEIEEANLKEGEEEELEEKRKIMMSSEKIRNNLSMAEEALAESCLDEINAAIKAIQKIEEFNSEYEELNTRIKDAYYELQEASRDISTFNEDFDFDEEEQNRVEERLDLINDLKRKYGNNIKEILEYKEKINEEIFEINNLENYRKSLREDLNRVKDTMYELADKMNGLRKEYGEKLSNHINEELKELEMKNACFNIGIDYSREYEFNENGLDSVEFLIRTNVGEEFKPLIKIASGGEMSRIMLAIKNVLADVDKIPVIIFDEIDTGISGVAANVTGDKMRQISKKHQVICVTHLATIAAKGDSNYFVSKEVINNKTRTNVRHLSEEEVLEEIARISSGSITDISIKHAAEMRKLKEICA